MVTNALGTVSDRNGSLSNSRFAEVVELVVLEVSRIDSEHWEDDG